MSLNDKQRALCDNHDFDFSGLMALFVNCTDEAGPGPSYADEGSGGIESDFTRRNTTFMTWNLMHLARLYSDAGGFPAHGNQRKEWDAGCRFDHPNPDYR